MDGSHACDLCPDSPSFAFCLCTQPVTFICHSCLPLHLSADPTTIHHHIPLPESDIRTLPGYIDRLISRAKAVDRGKAELYLNYTEVDRCISEFSDRINTVMTEIWAYGQRTLEELNRVRSELEATISAAVSEAEASIYEETPNLKYGLAVLLRSCDTFESLKIFEFSLAIADRIPESLIKFLFTSDFSTPPGVILPLISENSLNLYNVATDQVSTLNLTVSFTKGASFCFRDLQSILGVGGYLFSTAAFLIQIANCTTVPQADMHIARGLPALIRCESVIYAFGGFSVLKRPGDSCEKYSIADGKWTQMHNMLYAKYAFTAVLNSGKIYLPCANAPLEVFDIDSESFSMLSVSFRAEQLPGFDPGLVSFLINEELICITNSYQIGRLKIGKESSWRVERVEMRDRCSAVCNVTPVRRGKCVVWGRYTDGVMVKFDLEEGKLYEM